MPWSKLKNIMLLLLLLTNLALLALDLGRGLHSSRLQRQARADAVAFLREHGVELREENLPAEMGLTAQRITRDTQQEARLAEELLGAGAQRQTRGGGVTRYENSAGSVQFHSGGEYAAELLPGACPAEASPAEAAALLRRLDFEGELLEVSREQGVDRFTFRQRWKGSAVLNCVATLCYQDGCLRAIESARRLPGTPAPDRTEALLSVPTALMCFYHELTFGLGDACREIQTVEEGYVLSASLSGPAVLTPVWSISTDTGATYLLDAVSGTLKRAV